MKHFVLAFLLFLSSVVHLSAQNVTAREIVEKSLRVHASKEILKSYVSKVTYDKLGKIPSELDTRRDLENLLDSLIRSRPDTTRARLEKEMAMMTTNHLKRISEMHEGVIEWFFSDLVNHKLARITARPNVLKGTVDSTKSIHQPKSERFFTKLNPVEILWLMAMDSTALHYVGDAEVNSASCHQIQMRVENKWIDVYIDKQSHLVLRLGEPMIDTDPLFGQGPEPYRDIVDYHDYKALENFILPTAIEEITTRMNFTVRKRLTWSHVNQALPQSAFIPVISNNNRLTFRNTNIGDGVAVLERSNRWGNKRSLILHGPENTIDLFTELENLDTLNSLIIKEIKKIDRQARIVNVYSATNLNSVVSLSSFFYDKTHVLAPKGHGFVAQNSKDYAILQAETASGLLKTFSKEFQTRKISALIITDAANSLFGQMCVSYYLPKQKVVYFPGNGYSANNKNAYPDEKQLYDLIKNRNLRVEKIIFSAAYTDNAPLFMPFEEFEKRVLNTDFSIYKKWEK